jgi:ABC-2 type transport system ATP-binding protein
MVEVDHLVKHYGSIKAVNGISFEVKKGEVLGFLGPNGAGKSTTMKMITCFLTPTSGTARVQGFDINQNPIEVRQKLGYLPESAPLYEEMTVESFLKFIASVRGFDGQEAQMKIDKVVETCQLQKVVKQPIHTLSKGFRQRVCFSQALLHDPEVLILDEPTDGLDPNQKQAVRDLISAMKDDKVIIFSTHILEEVDAICTRALIISEGLVKIDGTPLELKKQSSFHNAVTLTLPKGCDESLKTALSALPTCEKVEKLEDLQEGKTKWRCFAKKGEELALHVMPLLKERNILTEEFHVEQGRLDEVFKSITKTTK